MVSERTVARPAAIACLVWCVALEALAQPRIAPGREADVMQLFAPYELGDEVAAGYALWNISIETDRVEVQVRGPEGVAPSLVLRHRAAIETDERTRSFAIARAAHARDGPAGAAADALIARVTANDDGSFWSVPERSLVEQIGVAPDDARSGPLVWRLGSFALLALALGWSLASGARLVLPGGARAVASRAAGLAAEHRYLIAIVGLAAAVALAIPERLPVHEHNSFLARLDCAHDPGCDEDPAGPAWLPTTFHVYGLALRALPYRLPTFGLVSLFFALLSLVLLHALIVRAYTRFDRRDDGVRVALFTVGFLALEPAWHRISVSGALWPYSLCCLFAAGLAFLSFRESDRVAPALAAAAFLALAVLGNMVFLALAPLVVIVPLAWRRESRRAPSGRGLLALALFVLAVAPQASLAASRALGDGALLAGRGLGGLVERIAEASYVYFFDPRLSPIALAAYLALGLVALARAPRLLAPFAWVLVVLLPVLSVWAGHPLGASYPVGFLHAFPLLYPLSFFAAAGAVWLIDRAPVPRRRLVTIAVAVLPILTLPFATEGIAFLRGERVLERELVALSDAFESLPPHDLLVEGPHIVPPLAGARPTGDPIEVAFPYGEYRYVLSRRGVAPAPLVPTEWLLTQAAPARGDRILFYLGSKLRSFQPSEIDAGLVPDTLERPELAAVRDRYRLVPVREFEIATAQHPAISVRLGADRVPRVTLGFYWLEPR